MPRPVAEQSTYVPGLDGIRALAVLAVLGYHLGVPHLSGGLLGVGVFFTLSGFLITRILLRSHERTGTLELRRFWVHRARRLLPALAVVLVVVLGWTALADRTAWGERWGQAWSAAAYVANWHTIGREMSYFDRFGGPGPLDHLWSLSVEEQFYLVWPVLLLLALVVLRLPRRWLAAGTWLLAAASFALLAALATPGFDNTRAYEGTDTRAGGILLGALLALVWADVERAATRSRGVRVGIQVLGVAALAGIGWLVASTDDYSMSLYSSGLLLLSVCSAALVAAVALPGSLVERALGLAPLRWLGERSYAIYLWQLPIIAAVSATALAEHRVWWGLVLTAATLVLAELSWRLVEDPVRRHGFAGALVRVRGWSVTVGGRRTLRLPVVPVGVAAVVALGTVVLASAQHAGPGQDATTATLAAAEGMPPLPPAVEPTADAEPAPAPRRKDRPARAESSRRGPTQTSCARVVHIGESTSVGLISPAYLPDRAARLPAQLRRHGVRDVDTDISGARSIVEKWHDQPNAQDAVRSRLAEGYRGCWEIAMGTNDAANQAVGGSYPYAERIDLLMERIGDQPVLWLTVKSLVRSGPYDDENMRAFDRALLDACERYPNLRVYDWRAEVRDAWYISDGIHFTTPGYAERSRRIASALAQAFPADGPPAPGCVVASGLH